MTIENNGTTARVSAGYSVKIPGGAAYSSEDKHSSISVEFSIDEGMSFDDLIAQLETVEAKLDVVVKAHTYAALGMSYDESATTGALSPVWPAGTAAPAAAPSSAPFKGGGGGQPRTEPKVQNADKPVVVLDGVQWYDQRPLKADKRYAAGASDFKAVNKEGDAFPQMWLREKSGELDSATVAVLDRNSISYE